MYLSDFIILFTEDSKPEPDDPSNDNMDADKLPSACDQSTQTEEVEATNEEGLTNPLPDETDVWNKNWSRLFYYCNCSYIDHVFFCFSCFVMWFILA